MARSRASRQEAKYDELKVFLVQFAKFRDARFDGPVSMTDSLEKVFAAAKGRGRRIPVSALRQAAHDMAAWSRQLSAGAIREADAYLRVRGSMTLTTVIGLVNDIVPKVLMRGQIRNDDEFYVMKELLNDMASELRGRERERAEKMVGAYESSPRRKRRRAG